MILPMLLVACTSPGPGADNHDKDTGGAAHGDDSAEPGDSSATGDTDSASTDPCGPYAAIAQGRTWTWSYNDAGVTGTMTTTITSFDGADGTLSTQFNFQYDGGSYTMNQSLSSTFRCDGGVVTEASTGTYNGTSGGTPFSGSWSVTYTAGGPQLPLDIEVGDTWSVRYAGQTTSNPGGTTSFDYTDRVTAQAEEQVSVTAGSWTAMRLATTSNATGSDVTTTSWVVADVGMVKSTTMALTSFVE